MTNIDKLFDRGKPVQDHGIVASRFRQYHLYKFWIHLSNAALFVRCWGRRTFEEAGFLLRMKESYNISVIESLTGGATQVFFKSFSKIIHLWALFGWLLGVMILVKVTNMGISESFILRVQQQCIGGCALALRGPHLPSDLLLSRSRERVQCPRYDWLPVVNNKRLKGSRMKYKTVD